MRAPLLRAALSQVLALILGFGDHILNRLVQAVRDRVRLVKVDHLLSAHDPARGRMGHPATRPGIIRGDDMKDALAILEVVGIRAVFVEGLGCDVVLAHDIRTAFIDAALGVDDLRTTADWILARAALSLARGCPPPL